MYTGGIIEYISEFWNWIDITRALLFNVYCVFVWFGQEGDNVNTIFVFTLLFSWFRGITYFKIFERTRYLIKLIMEASVDIVAFFILLFYTTVAFALVMQSLDLDKNIPPEDELNLFQFFLNSYKQNLGDLPDDPVSFLTWILFFIITIINPVIMLNLLISIMGDTYGRVKEGKVIADSRELSEMILEVETLMYWNKPVKTVSFLKIVCHESELDVEEEGIDAKIKILKDTIQTLGDNIISAKNEIISTLDGAFSEIRRAIENRRS